MLFVFTCAAATSNRNAPVRLAPETRNGRPIQQMGLRDSGLLRHQVDAAPRSFSGPDRGLGRACGRAAASPPSLAQRLGERPVVPGQACHLPVEPLEPPPASLRFRRPGVAVRLQARPGRLLELVEDGPDLRVGRPGVRRPGDHERPVLVLEVQRVRDGGQARLDTGICGCDPGSISRDLGSIPESASQRLGRAGRPGTGDDCESTSGVRDYGPSR